MNNSVLIVEDDKELGEIFVDLFALEDIDAELIQDGALALERIITCHPHVVVLDMHLPHVSGMEILTRIRADELTAQTKVMVVTADALLADSAKHLADAILIKPVSGYDIIDTAHRLLEAVSHA